MRASSSTYNIYTNDLFHTDQWFNCVSYETAYYNDVFCSMLQRGSKSYDKSRKIDLDHHQSLSFESDRPEELAFKLPVRLHWVQLQGTILGHTNTLCHVFTVPRSRFNYSNTCTLLGYGQRSQFTVN